MDTTQAHCPFKKEEGTSHLAHPESGDTQQSPYACQELDENAQPRSRRGDLQQTDLRLHELRWLGTVSVGSFGGGELGGLHLPPGGWS